MDTAARKRAELRRAHEGQWPVRRYRLVEEPQRDPLDRSTVDERLAMMWPLAVEAWAVAGKELPTYSRSETPCRMVRGYRGRKRDSVD